MNESTTFIYQRSLSKRNTSQESFAKDLYKFVLLEQQFIKHQEYEMKKLFIVLSAVLIAACSDGEIGGYTGSIIKGSKALNESSSPTTQNPTLKKSALSLEEELSGLDEDELRDKLMNTNPWTLALARNGADPEQSSSSSESETSSSSKINDGTLALPHNPKLDKIEPFTWKETLPYFTEDSNHGYGFDQDPEQKDPITYISVKNNENASFIFHAPSDKAYKKFCIVHEKENKSFDYVNILTNGQIHKFEPKVYGTGKEFKIIGYKSNAHPKTCPKQSKTEFTQRIKVIPYDEKIKNIAYIEINGNEDFVDEKKCKEGLTKECKKECAKGFSKACAELFFNDIYKQAVIKGNFNEEKPEDYNINNLYDKKENGLIVIWMTSPKVNEDNIYNEMKESALNQARPSYDDSHWHIVYAINKVRKIWDLDMCKPKESDLKNCIGFNPESEHKDTRYTYYNKNSSDKKEKADIQVKQIKNGERTKTQYLLYINGKKHTFKPGDCLYTDNGYPVIPSTNGIAGGTAAVSSRDGFEKFDTYLAYGSTIFVPRRNGSSSYYVLMHELGHSLGLTDVTVSKIHKEEVIDDKSEDGFINYDKSIGQRKYKNYYATTETNLMSWQLPAGKKLRYRPTPIACTGGKKYYRAIKTNSAGNTVFDKEKGIYFSIEREVKVEIGIEPNSSSSSSSSSSDGKKWEIGFEPNQWECVRGNCFDSDQSSKYTIKAREIFWNKTDWCEENQSPNGEDAKNIYLHTGDDDESKKRDRETRQKIIDDYMNSITL